MIGVNKQQDDVTEILEKMSMKSVLCCYSIALPISSVVYIYFTLSLYNLYIQNSDFERISPFPLMTWVSPYMNCVSRHLFCIAFHPKKQFMWNIL